jgi:hypothetical protein
MPQHVFIPPLCIRHNILDRVSMIKAFAYFRDTFSRRSPAAFSG